MNLLTSPYFIGVLIALSLIGIALAGSRSQAHTMSQYATLTGLLFLVGYAVSRIPLFDSNISLQLIAILAYPLSGLLGLILRSRVQRK